MFPLGADVRDSMSPLVDSETSDSLVSVCRTALGDSLRSVIYFTPDDFEFLYVRQDLDTSEDVESVKAFFVESERPLFEAGPKYTELSTERRAEPEIGEYEFTIRIFSDGYIVPIIVGNRGVLTTTDSLDIDSFEEFAVALRRLLVDLDEPAE